MCTLNEQQIRKVYLRCNCIPLQRLVELCMNPTSGITIDGLREAGYRKVDQLAELCHHQESDALEKEWNSIAQMPDDLEKIECLNKFIERLYTYDLTLARKYRKMSENLLEELRERNHPIFGIIDTMEFEWAEAIESNTIEGYTRFMSRYPNSEFQEEAERRIQNMKSLLDDLKNNPSKYGREKMFDIISNNRLTREDLVDNSGILTDRAYEHIRRYPHLKDEQRELPISRMENPYSKDGSVDVIFWGIPRAGITCMLAGLLGLKGQLGFNFDPRESAGGGRFAMELWNYARCSMLPPQIKDIYIQIVTTQLNNENGFPNNVSLIKMPGEKLSNHLLTGKSMSWDDLGAGAVDLLSNRNKKIVFFVITPSNEETIGWMDTGEPIIIKQSAVIQSILALLQKNNKVMVEIVSLHFILTKCDSLGKDIDQDIIRDILIDQGYMDCFQYVKSVCQKYDINKQIGSNVGIYPFSLGKFMPGDTYIYDEARALMMLRVIQSMLPIGPKTPLSGIVDSVRSWFKS